MTGFKFHSLIPTPPSTGFISFHRIDHFHLHVIIPMDHLRVSYIILARFYIRDRPTSNFDLIHHFVWLERGVSPFDLNQVGTRIFQFSLEIIHNYHGLFIMTIITIITFLFLDSFGFFWILRRIDFVRGWIGEGGLNLANPGESLNSIGGNGRIYWRGIPCEPLISIGILVE